MWKRKFSIGGQEFGIDEHGITHRIFYSKEKDEAHDKWFKVRKYSLMIKMIYLIMVVVIGYLVLVNNQ